MNPELFFSPTYASARSRFIAVASETEGNLSSIPLTGAHGAEEEDLAVDVLEIGPTDASKLFVIGSGTHGVEGFCGSGCQLGLISEGLQRLLPPDTSLLLVHALNPYGFSHCRRVNEDNVDVNRNFISDYAAPPQNPNYDELHSSLLPADWFGSSRATADDDIQAFIKSRGERAYQAALTGGQYTHADGIFYGGDRPTWSNSTWQTIVKNRMRGRSVVLYIDIHTGVGPYGYGEPILVDSSYDNAIEKARAWLGSDVTSIAGNDCISAIVEGPVSNPLRWHLEATSFMALSLEYGTRPVQQALDSLRADNWLYLNPDATDAQRREIKAQIRDAFYIEESEWKIMVWRRFLEVYTRGLAALDAA